MNRAGSNGPQIREAFYVVLATFTLYLVTLLIVSGNDPVSLLLAETSIVLPVIVWVRMRRYPFRAVFRLQQINPLLILLGLIIGFGFSILTGELNFLIQKIVPMQREVLEGLTEAMVYESPFDLIVMILTFVVIAGIGEELLFRGLLLGAFEKSVNVTRAVIYSSLVFTFMHFNPWWTIEIFFLGVLTGVLAWRSNSLYPAIAMHMMVNLMAILLTNEDLPFLQLYLESGHIAPILLLASGAGVAGGMVLFYVCSRPVKED
jgi:membrane protease YdiL (CAAX protease family)